MINLNNNDGTCTKHANMTNREWNLGHNVLHQLEQPNVPSVPYPVFNPINSPAILVSTGKTHRYNNFQKVILMIYR